jgi:hypothetical protein
MLVMVEVDPVHPIVRIEFFGYSKPMFARGSAEDVGYPYRYWKQRKLDGSTKKGFCFVGPIDRRPKLGLNPMHFHDLLF